MNERIGFIGVGHMGAPLINCMVRKGLDLTLFDIREEAVAPYQARGVAVAGSLEELARQTSIICFCLLNDADVDSLLFDESGLFSLLGPQHLLITHSTLSTDICIRIGEYARSRGMGFIDAPVSGGQKERDDGTMTVFVGGREDDFLRARPLLDTIGATVVHMGPNGAGAIGKIANNFMQLSNTIAAIEAMRLANAYGVSEDAMVQLSSVSSGSSWSLQNLFFFDDMMANHQLADTPDALFAYLAKDIGLAAQGAADRGVDLALARSNAALAPEIFSRRKALGRAPRKS